jgi:hypothetical protein
MPRTSRNRKIAAALIAAMVCVLQLGGMAAASTPNAAGNDSAYMLDAYALYGEQGTELHLAVRSDSGQTAVFKKVQVKLRGTDGKLKSTTNYTDPPSPAGRTVLRLENASLNDTVEIQALVQPADRMNTVVLNGVAAAAEFAVMPHNVVVPEFQGYGAQMNMHLYTALNDPSRGFVGNTPPEDLDNVEAKIAALRPGLTRIFLSPANYDPGNENRMESFYKTVELAQEVGANVNITWWFLETNYDDPVKMDELLRENMSQFAGTLVDLIENKGITVIREVTIQNEPNTTRLNQENNIETVYEKAYRLLDQYLKDAGIRDRILFAGGDLVVNDQEKWFRHMAERMGDILDVWTVHIYWNYFQTSYMQERLSGIKAVYDSIPAEQRKPLQVSEYGVRGIRQYAPGEWIQDFNYYRRNGANNMTNTAAGYYQEGNDTPYYDPDKGELIPVNETVIAAFQQAWFNMQAANMGFSGFSKWDMYRAQYDFGYQDHSLIGYVFEPEPGEDRWPLRPAYYMTWLMSNAAGQGSQVLGQEGAAGTKMITPFRSASGDYTVFALNTDDSAGATFHIGNLPADTEFHIIIWNADGSGKLSAAGSINSGAAGAVAAEVPAGAMAAITTASLALPE